MFLQSSFLFDLTGHLLRYPGFYRFISSSALLCQMEQASNLYHHAFDVCFFFDLGLTEVGFFIWCDDGAILDCAGVFLDRKL